MQKEKAILEALQATVKDLQHLDELRAMQTLNSGYSEIRNSTLNEIERLMLEKRTILMWVLE